MRPRSWSGQTERPPRWPHRAPTARSRPCFRFSRPSATPALTSLRRWPHHGGAARTVRFSSRKATRGPVSCRGGATWCSLALPAPTFSEPSSSLATTGHRRSPRQIGGAPCGQERCEEKPKSRGRPGRCATHGRRQPHRTGRARKSRLSVRCDGRLWTVPIFEVTRRDGRLYGLGMGNMKGAAAAMTTAASLLDQLRDPWRGRITFTAVADEVVLGENGAASLLREQPDPRGDGLLCGQGPGYRRLALGKKGVLRLDVRATAAGGHSSSMRHAAHSQRGHGPSGHSCRVGCHPGARRGRSSTTSWLIGRRSGAPRPGDGCAPRRRRVLRASETGTPTGPSRTTILPGRWPLPTPPSRVARRLPRFVCLPAMPVAGAGSGS